MWELYKLLGKGTGKHYLLDEIVEMLRTIHPEKIKKSLKLMYGIVPLNNSMDIAILFTKGLNKNKFFEFQDFVEKLNGTRH